ncbi:MAG: ABC transporter ATP-binding protein [Oscillospiraceae bacterium]|nr:ABC transporter ATP-binding protein [Oscillospiraceae bacterium]
MNDFENAIELKGVTKKYDGFTLNNVSFAVPKGSIMGFIGQNGAGKSTTIKAILGIIGIDSGEIQIFGKDHLKEEYELKEDIAAVFDELPFHDSLNAKQINIIMSGMYRNWDKALFFRYLDRFGLPQKKKCGKFSKGMRMKLQIAVALSHGAKLLIMDEATTGLDPVVRNEILDIFLEYLQDENKSILMSSHITSDLEKIADCVTFIDNGEILLSDYKDSILESHAVIRCSKADYTMIDQNDFISARVTDFGADVMVSDKNAMQQKYPKLMIEPTTLEEIMLFYVNRKKKEWS